MKTQEQKNQARKLINAARRIRLDECCEESRYALAMVMQARIAKLPIRRDS